MSEYPGYTNKKIILNKLLSLYLNDSTNNCDNVMKILNEKEPDREIKYITSSSISDLNKKNYFYTLPHNIDVISTNLELANKITNTQQKQEVIKILLAFQDVLLLMKKNKFDISSIFLPPLKLIQVDDGSILIEWAFKDIRIGFAIERNIPLSSWYLVSNSALDEYNKSGLLKDDDLHIIIIKLLTIILLFQ